MEKWENKDEKNHKFIKNFPLNLKITKKVVTNFMIHP